MPELLCSAILAIQKGESGGHSMSYVQKLVTLIVPALVKALKEVILLIKVIECSYQMLIWLFLFNVLHVIRLLYYLYRCVMLRN
jgi:hypothetical protein